ncbi:hypothetical protein MANES_04G058300v8 [Manihot esculenta]|uniref:Uncharacterized protein n=1 Tax=Manihot esculenta TaxID=3983 RepID=A0ACB7HXX8_MANES|nr:hypothetical protein MANES_04G058300v8 [Manihot esculenta]
MASSKVLATSSTTNPDMPRQPSLCSSLSTLLADLQNQNQFSSNSQSPLLSATMDDLLKNIYSYPTPPTPDDPHAPPFSGGASISRDGSFPMPKEAASKSVDDVWKEIVAGGDHRRDENGGGGGIEGMTLEDFLTKAGAVREEDVRGVGIPVQGLGNGMMVVAEGGKGRQKRRAVEEPPMDKATQQKQRRMIKNRESAARSRERKQAYTIELESLVTQLEEENSRLLREEVEQKKKRFKELMENLIPVVEKRRPPRVLRRVNSVQW